MSIIKESRKRDSVIRLPLSFAQFLQDLEYQETRSVESLDQLISLRHKDNGLVTRDKGFDIAELAAIIDEAGLTTQERLLVGLIAYGLTQNEIIKKLGVTIQNFRTIRKYAYKKIKGAIE